MIRPLTTASPSNRVEQAFYPCPPSDAVGFQQCLPYGRILADSALACPKQSALLVDGCVELIEKGRTPLWRLIDVAKMVNHTVIGAGINSCNRSAASPSI